MHVYVGPQKCASPCSDIVPSDHVKYGRPGETMNGAEGHAWFPFVTGSDVENESVPNHSQMSQINPCINQHSRKCQYDGKGSCKGELYHVGEEVYSENYKRTGQVMCIGHMFGNTPTLTPYFVKFECDCTVTVSNSNVTN